MKIRGFVVKNLSNSCNKDIGQQLSKISENIIGYRNSVLLGEKINALCRLRYRPRNLVDEVPQG